MIKEKYISEALLKDTPKKKLGLKIKEGAITPEHLSQRVTDEIILPLINSAIGPEIQDVVASIISTTVMQNYYTKTEADGKYINQNMINASSGVAGLNRYGYLPTDLVQVSSQVQESSPMPVTSGAVYAAIQDFVTASVSNLINYYTKFQTYSKSEVDSLISSIKQFTYQSADSLPTASASTMYKIYLIPAANSETNNAKDEYITVENESSYSWEKIGSTNIDLSGYYQKPASGIPASDLASGVIPDISGKADKSEMSVVAGTGANADKTTITLKSGTSATVLTQHQDISGKQDVLTFDSTPTASSNNPVTSGGVKSALDGKADASNTYTKSEINNLIVPAGSDTIIVSALPASGQANTIYRVPGSNSYADYGWDGTQFVKLAEYATAYSGRVWY